MKKIEVLLTMIIGITNIYAQDYDLQGLAEACIEYSKVSSFHEGLAKVCKDNKWGFIDKKGKLVIPIQYNNVRDFSEGFAAVENDEYKWGYIDKEGNMNIPFKFTYISDYKEGYAFADDTFIDDMGIPLPIKINDGGRASGDDVYFSEGFAAVTPYDDNPQMKMGYIGKYGQIRIAFKYNDCFHFKEGVACVGISTKDKFGNYERKCGYIDDNGRTIIPVKYSEFSIHHTCNDGLIGVCNFDGDMQWGYLNKSGIMVIPYKYWSICEFSEGLAFVWDKTNHWKGFIDTEGNKVVECDYSMNCKGGYKEGMCILETNPNKFTYIDKSFNFITDVEFDEAKDFSDGLALVRIGEKWGYIDREGRNTFSLNTQ